LTFKYVEPRDKVHVWAALLHDIAKPACWDEYESFHGHAAMGAEMAYEILTRLRFSDQERKEIVSAVRDHMKFLDITKMRKSRLRRFMAEPHFITALNVHRADCLASNKDFSAIEYLEKKQREFIKEDGSVLPKPLVTGHQVMKHLDIKPGPLVGTLLEKIQTAQLESIITTATGALNYAVELYTQHKRGEL